ncbi:MAG: alpha/beta hydrolase [Chloroflexota bacterium]
MKKWSDGYVNANGISVHYYRTGGDKPQVVLNHGAMDDGLCWTHLAKELEADYDLIMLDGRGHGLSDSGAGDYHPGTRARDMAEVILALRLEDPVVGGHSLGADGSMHLAALYPDIPRAIFLEDPPIVMPGEPIFGGEMGSQGDRVLKLMITVMKTIKILPKFMGIFLARKMMPNSPEDEIIPWLDSKKRVSNDFLKSMKIADTMNISAQFDTLKKIKVPTLLIMGDREKGSIVSTQVAQEMGKILPDLQVTHLEGANHDIRRAKFDEYLLVLKKFLREAYH